MAKAQASKFGLVVGLLIIVLIAILTYVIMSSGQYLGWQIDDGSLISDSYAGGDGTLYMVSNHSQLYQYAYNTYVLAMRPDGSVKWKHPLSELCRADNGTDDEYYARIAATDDDSVYVQVTDHYLTNGTDGLTGQVYTVLAAVSSDGRLRWTYPLKMVYDPWSGDKEQTIAVRHGRIYVNDNLTQYVLDKQGNVTTEVGLVPKAAAIGPDGVFYVNRAASVDIQCMYGYTWGDWENSPIVQAYSPDGTMLWERNLSGYSLDYSTGASMLTFHGDTLYVQLTDGILALDREGRIVWEWRSEDGKQVTLYKTMPFDADGNSYLYRVNASRTGLSPYNTFDFYVISPTGRLTRTYTDDDSKNILARAGQIEYYTPDIPADHAKAIIPETVEGLSELESISIRAYDAARKQDLWSVELPLYNITAVTITEENVNQLFPQRIASDITLMNSLDKLEHYPRSYHDIFNTTPVSILSLKEANAATSGDIVYVSLYTYSYESPSRYGQSRCAYASCLYALDQNGTLLWVKPATGNIYWMTAGNNSTVYYSTTDGRVFYAAMAVAGGLTLAAILYAIAHFFMAGTVTRARDRLNTNENRMRVLKYITDNPGSTMRDVSRGLGMNLGTIRYHLLILGLNHKIATCQADGKHMRYFVNSNAYSKEEQVTISLIRREGIRKVLEALLKQSGQTNRGLSQALGMRESAVNRYTGELIAAGLVEKVRTREGAVTYSIISGRRDIVSYALGWIAAGSRAESVTPE